MAKELDSDAVKKIVEKELAKILASDLDDFVSKILKQKNSKSRKETLLTIKDGIEAVFKVLWQKRDFWKTDIK